MNQLFQGKERRSHNRYPLISPIHLMADAGQILIGSVKNISSHGLKAELTRDIGTNAIVTFSFSHGKACIRGDGRVVWSDPAAHKKLCGITFLKMKQKDVGLLHELLERITSPRCPMCDSKIDIEKLIPLFGMQFPRERIDLGNALPLMEIAHLLTSGLSREAIVQQVLEVIKNHFDARAVQLLLYNNGTGALELKTHLGLDSVEIFSPNVGKLIPGKAMSQGRIIFIPDVQKDPSFVSKHRAPAAGIQSIAAIPLRKGDKTLGVLALYSSIFERRETLETEERKLLSALGSLVTVAMGFKVYPTSDDRQVPKSSPG